MLDNDSDPGDDRSALPLTVVTSPGNGRATVNEPANVGQNRTITYEPNANYTGTDTFTYRVRDTGSPSLSSTVSVSVEVDAVNDAPTFTSPTTTRRVSESAEAGDNVGAPVTATDVDENDTLTYSLSGADASSFDIDAEGQIKVGDGVTFDVETKDTYTVMVDADDGNGGTASIGVTITVTTGPVGPLIFIGGGGGPPPGPTPSEADFEWTVTRDIEEPDSGNDWPTGLWSDGASLFIAENGQGAADDIYAYDLVTGERVDEHEFELHETNRAPRGFWSDGDTVWVSDSGQDRLFAYDLETGDRVEEREIELPRDNRDARGIWSDGATMWVLDGRADALFAYDLASGELLAEYELDSANDDPHGIRSDHFTVWVSNHDPKRLFAYRLQAPEGPAAEDADAIFKGLRGARNNSPRGIWSDGEVMYVADESDDRVYTYNMPDAIDARLAHAQRHRHRGVDPSQPDYEAVVADGVTETTVAAEAAQDDAMVEIAPNDADVEADGHQIAVEGGAEITVTVTSPDDSRKKVYRVELVGAGPAPECLRGAVTVGFSLVVSEGGSIENVDACARSRNVTALYTLYTLDGGEYVSYIPGAPELVNDRFSALYAGGVPALTPLIARSDGPATAAPVASGVTGPWAACLQGEIVEGFNLEVVGEEAVLAAVGDPEVPRKCTPVGAMTSFSM